MGWFGIMGCMRGCDTGNNQPVIGHRLVALVDAVEDCIKLSHGFS